MKKTFEPQVEIMFQHGWAFDSQSWSVWLPHLKESFGCATSVCCGDRGYFGIARPLYAFQKPDSFKLLIVHSLGLHLVPEHIFSQANLVVAIGSFLHFHDNSQIQARQSKKVIDLMQERLNKEPFAVIDDFYKQCYSPLTTSHALLARDTNIDLNVDLLKADLRLLSNNHFNIEWLKSAGSLLIIHGLDDKIVPASHAFAMHDQIPNSMIVTFEKAGHALPFTHAASCCMNIRNVMQRMLCAAIR